MVAQSTTAGDQSDENKAMAATENEKAIEKVNAKDDASKEDQKFGQKAKKYAGVETPIAEDADDDDDEKTAKNLWKALGKAGTDDAAKTSGKPRW